MPTRRRLCFSRQRERSLGHQACGRAGSTGCGSGPFLGRTGWFIWNQRVPRGAKKRERGGCGARVSVPRSRPAAESGKARLQQDFAAPKRTLFNSTATTARCLAHRSCRLAAIDGRGEAGQLKPAQPEELFRPPRTPTPIRWGFVRGRSGRSGAGGTFFGRWRRCLVCLW